MNKQVIAIGGGGFGRNGDCSEIEKYLLKQIKRSCPKICFIPTATGDSDSYKADFYSAFSKLNCLVTHIDLFKRTKNLKKTILDQDIIYVGGGNTKSMLAVWKEWGIDKILLNAYDNGVIMSGVSAGAICWFEKGITDSWSEELKILNCLGFIPGVCCPHYLEETERRPKVFEFINTKKIKSCYGVDGGSAIHFINGIHTRTIKFIAERNSYFLKLKKNEVVEMPLEDENIIGK